MTNQGSVTDSQSLDSLTSELNKLLKKNNNYKNIKLDSNYKRILKGIARYQFGEIGLSLLTDCKIKGKYPNLKIMASNQQRGMLTGERGLISLTVAGAKHLLANQDTTQELNYVVNIEDFIPKGSVMAIGVTNASETIRVGDEVIAVHSGDFRAVGQAMMSGPEMVLNNRGVAVKVRHHC